MATDLDGAVELLLNAADGRAVRAHRLAELTGSTPQQVGAAVRRLRSRGVRTCTIRVDGPGKAYTAYYIRRDGDGMLDAVSRATEALP